MKKTLSLLLSFVLLLSLCACSSGTEDTVAEQTGEIGSAPLSAQGNAEEETGANPIHMAFSTDDGLIQVSIQDEDADFIPSTMPVLRVRPQVITSDMARRMAKGMFGDAEFFEYSEELSKAEVGEMIAVWEDAVTDEAIRADHGADAPQDWIDSVRDDRLAILEYYRNAYAHARDEVTPVPCQWKFWPDEHYAIHGFDYAGTDPSYTDDIPAGISVTLRAVTTVDGIPYEFWVNNNERAGFRNHSLAIFVMSPDELFAGGISEAEQAARWREWNISTGLYSPSQATDAELAAACQRAVQMASEMGLGEWRFSAKPVDGTSIPGGGWQIALTGQPVYEGFPVSWQNPSGHRDFYLESLTLLMKNDGTVIDLRYNSPLEIVEVMEPAVPLKTWDKISPIALQAMRSWDYGALIPDPDYGSEQSWWTVSGAVITDMKVDVDSVCVGYTRIPYDTTDFLLIPSVSFLGRLEVLGTIPGVHESPMSLLLGEEEHYDSFLVLDLRDGSPIR